MPSRPTRWVDTLMTRDVGDGTEQRQDLQGDLGDLEKRTATIIRVILDINSWSTTLAGAYGVQRVVFGLGVAPEDAWAVGVVPDPSAPTEKPVRGWLWWGLVYAAQNGTGAPVLSRIQADLRAARKVENGHIYLVMKSTNRQGTPFTTSVEGTVRILMKL